MHHSFRVLLDARCGRAQLAATAQTETASRGAAGTSSQRFVKGSETICSSKF
jgi:hypothetical protein